MRRNVVGLPTREFVSLAPFSGLRANSYSVLLPDNLTKSRVFPEYLSTKHTISDVI